MSPQTLTNKRILLGVTGGIAAYKSAELVRRLQDQGATVRVVMTRAATEFITPMTMQALSGHPVHLDMLDPEAESAMGHIELARWADLILVAPATAHFIARLAGGHGDDLLTTLCLACECPMAIAPAMNQAMWAKASTQQNCADLQQRQVRLLGPADGLQACGDVGTGRLLDVDEIVRATGDLFQTGVLAGKRVVITAGPTREAIDPVRFISNHSSGKQGYALAVAAVEAGASVVLVSGPTHLDPPDRVEMIHVISANDMYEAVMKVVSEADIFIGVAAVADYRPVTTSLTKIKKSSAPSNRSVTLELVENPDIIAHVGHSDPRPFTVGFAAETGHLEQYARKKLSDKHLDMIIGNDVSDQEVGFNSDQNRTTVIWPDRTLELPIMSKSAVAGRIIELIAQTIHAR
ncbi:MAG: bifunctional phosphopantothenoylcysteine decarboxylase/phosphopantothenate--cysteine ligase CoaBC [Proteobacteria bacterium]|jgi:phosphopantothenoylcysteine decarboxylase / phosphopantothenate---cysteine ligase|nr:bifunctional phosphopantothenoylcysteine decarboxylase/phosphopantothenate--cysteine ligase CoaBC [Pseudomonadota bacterium]MDA1300723.1 bifunctional phosphopantothenoylcysteine decarboxylase/phosphopantothenate--cysteine ligase CoaBC [Pseudomonadota bacterium]